MRFREIGASEAQEIFHILAEECGYADPYNGRGFIEAIIAPQPDGGHICHEYRFQGALGFGGKFRNNGNRENTPYVDCYREDETPARLAMIKRANARLDELFANRILKETGE